jgi:hypothetical protein
MGDAINSAAGVPNLDQRAEVHTASVPTDANGDGSTTVSWDREFEGNVRVFVEPDEVCTTAVTAKGDSQATVAVGGATADSSVSVEVAAFGDD